MNDRHEAIDGQPSEIRVANAREVGRRNAGSVMRSAHSQAFPIERLDDFGGQDRLELLGIRVLVPKAAEQIAASPPCVQLFFYRNISFSRFKRSLVGSISRFGVLMPCVDFFGNACTTRIPSASCTA
jgi:hypothetical protein